jgi:hypothetical protein
MDQERNLGVTEARFALTILTCLLVAVGYVALLRLGGSRDAGIEPGNDDAAVTQHDPQAPSAVEPEPFVVLHVEKAEQADRSTNKRR